MSIDINSQINEARELFNQAFRMKEVPKRNIFLRRGLEEFDAIEKLDVTDIQKRKISNIKTTYSKELLKVLRPSSLGADIETFLNLMKMNKNFKELFDDNPQLKKNFDTFISSLKRSSEFRRLLSQIETDS